MAVKRSFYSFQRLVGFLCIVCLSFTNLGFNHLPGNISFTARHPSSSQSCALPGTGRTFSLDGVDLAICLPFVPEIFTGASQQDIVQSAIALDRATGNSFSIYAVPYGLQPAADNLPAARSGISAAYQELSFKAYAGDILADFQSQAVSSFGQSVQGRTVVINNKTGGVAAQYQIVTQWVLEAGERVWLIRLTAYSDSLTGINNQPDARQFITLESPDLNRPSISLQLSMEASRSDVPPVSASATDLPFPSWWSGDCDVNNFAGSYPLGASYRGVKTCGPLGSMHLVNFGAGYSQYEWQCVEYVKRYLYIAYGIIPYSANGNTVVWNYSGTRLEKVVNGTANKGPFAGDVISYNGPSTYGHTSLVTAANIDVNGNGTVTIAEQNYSKTGTRTHTVSNWFINSSDGVSGWLHDNQAANNPPAGFTKCADEGGLCNLAAPAEVVYGARDTFTLPRVFSSGVDCKNAVFGDPLGGVAKSCYFKTASTWDSTNWSVKYFNGPAHWLDDTNLTGEMCAETIAVSGLDKNYGTSAPCGNGIADDWVAEYNAMVDFSAGNYVFQAQNDNGVKVWVNGQSVFNRAGSSALSSACPAISLSGTLPVRVILREETGSARVRLVWTTDTGICALPGSFSKTGPANGSTGQSLNPTISWGASRNVNSYSYCIDNLDNSKCDTSWQNAASLTSKTLGGLAYDTTYFWQVRASNSGGQTTADGGVWWSFRTRTEPPACFVLSTSHTGNGANPVAAPANGSGCPAGQYHPGDLISLTASPASDSGVGSWSGTDNDASTAVTNSLTMPAQASTVVVNYVQQPPDPPVTISPDGKIIDDFHPIYKWYPSSRASSYLLTVYNEGKTTFIINNLVVPGSACTGSPIVCMVHPQVTLENNNHAFKVAAVNTIGSAASPWRSFYMARILKNFVSTGSQDGYVVESTESSGVGGWFFPTGNAFYVGDGLMNRQNRGILSFNTSSLPDTAIILSARLKLEKQSIVGTDPMLDHGGLIIDIKRNYFGASPALGLDDFAAPAGVNFAGSIGKIPVGTLYTGTIAAAGLPFFNRTGLTQLRLRFQIDDNNNNLADSIGFFSGDAVTVSKRPVLVLIYYVP